VWNGDDDLWKDRIFLAGGGRRTRKEEEEGVE
jgi:hypothetical protein